MLLTLNTSAIGASTRDRRAPEIDLLDVPRFASEELGLNGLNVTTNLLAGVSRERMEALRERADKVGCACLVLIDDTPLPFGTDSDDEGDGAIERAARVIEAGRLLGCNAAAIEIDAPNEEEAFDLTVERLKEVLDRAERVELNLLISPTAGLTSEPDRVTELIKKVGRFRLMTLPDFQRSARTDDAGHYLRRLTPYAGAVTASTVEFSTAPEPGASADVLDAIAEGEVQHTAYALAPALHAVKSVGFDGPLGLDYRGPGDVTLGLLMSRAAIEAALGSLEDG